MQQRTDIRNIVVFLAAVMLLLPLASCARNAEEQATTTAQSTQESATTSTETSTRNIFELTEESVPFYQYYDDDDALQLELYYDTANEEGVGIYHYADGYGYGGFRVGAAEKAVWKDHKYSITSEYHDEIIDFSSQPEIYTDYIERKTYNNQGKLSGYYAECNIEPHHGPYNTRDLIKITWHYRQDGTLWKKDSLFNFGGTYRSTETFYYDKSERLKYVYAYNTSGCVEDYYIYEGSNNAPAYRLTVIHASGPACEESFVKY